MLTKRRETSALKNGNKPVRNPFVVLREEFDDWAVLFNPDAGRGFGLNPTGVYVWQLIDGERSIDDILKTLRRNALETPTDADEQISAFVDELAQCGLASCAAESSHSPGECPSPCPTGVPDAFDQAPEASDSTRGKKLRYESPRLETFTLERSAQGWCTSNGSGAADCCQPGNGAKGNGGGTALGCCIDGSGAIWTPYQYNRFGCYNGSAASCQSGYYACFNGGGA